MLPRPGLPAVAATVAAAVILAAGALALRPEGRQPAPTIPAAAVERPDAGPAGAAPGSTPAPVDAAAAAGPSSAGPGPGAGATPSAAPPATDGIELASAEPGLARPEAARAAAAWVDRTAAATGIPAPAVRGYGDATLALAAADPACHLGWTTLAGIGDIESGHGTHGGSQLDVDGRAVPAILGPALDGDGFAAIRATARSTALHGDPRWDHAVGPLQFIPSTWWRWGADGDGDGTADPQDVDDAALAAALYLCAGGQDMATPAGWSAAVRSYNHSDAYVAAVLRSANAYAATGG